MSIPKSWGCNNYKLRSLVSVLCRYRVHRRSNGNLSHHDQEKYHRSAALLSKFSDGHSIHGGFRSTGANTGIYISTLQASSGDVINKLQPSVPTPPPPKSMFPTWWKWLLGSVLTLVMPAFWNIKWGSLLSLPAKVEVVVEEVESVAEVVEMVASTAEKVSAGVAEKLPDNSTLKEAVLFVEHVSCAAANDAELTEKFIHKVEELEHDLTDLGKMIEPVVDEIIPKQHGGK